MSFDLGWDVFLRWAPMSTLLTARLEVSCRRCGSALGPSEAHCGSCGATAPWIAIDGSETTSATPLQLAYSAGITESWAAPARGTTLDALAPVPLPAEMEPVSDKPVPEAPRGMARPSLGTQAHQAL